MKIGKLHTTAEISGFPLMAGREAQKIITFINS
jgi:hypothetical protein